VKITGAQRARQVVLLILALYETEPCGGRLHIVVDEGNVETEHIQWSIDHIDDHETDAVERVLCLLIARMLLDFDIDTRGKILEAADKAMDELGMW
jgi:hypothetical protein